MKIMNDKRLLILGALIFIGVLVRSLFLTAAVMNLGLCSDEAILGLMAKHVWSGELPLITWAQPHGGTLETYLVAPLYLLFGTHPLVVKIWMLLMGIGYFVFIYLLTKQLFGGKVGLIALALATAPPVYLVLMSSLGVSMNNPALLGIVVILYLTCRIIKGDNRVVLGALLGLVAGLAFWVHQIVFYGIAISGLFLLFYDWKLCTRKYFWVLAACFALGSLPLWVNNFSNNFEIFELAKGEDLPTTLAKIKMALAYTMPTVWGLYLPTYIDNPFILSVPGKLMLPAGGIYLGLLIIGLRARHAGPRFLGKVMLILLFLITLVMFARTERSNLWSTRYLIHTYTALLPLVALGLSAVLIRSRIAFAAVLALLVGFNVYGWVRVLNVWQDPILTAEKLDLPDLRPLTRFLRAQDIRHGYLHYCFSYPVVFATDEELVLSPSHDERFGRFQQPYLSQVAAQTNVAYIFHKSIGFSADQFQNWLKQAGIGFTQADCYPFIVFYDFISPSRPGPEDTIIGRPIPSDAWVIEASHNAPDAPRAVDGDLKTRWGSAQPQQPGMAFMVDLKQPYEICKIEMFCGRYWHDFPAGIEIRMSLDGTCWDQVYSNRDTAGGMLYWIDGQPRLSIAQEGAFRLLFSPRQARYVKITQIGTHARFDWSIAELNIYSAENE